MTNFIKVTAICSMCFALLAAGCAAPQDNAQLMEARSVYNQAVNDPQLQENAPVALREAEQMLAKAEQADKDIEVTHFAYMATKKTELARNLSDYKTAQKNIADLRREREQYIAEMRRQEADQARQETRQAIQAKETAQQRYEGLIEEERQTQLKQQQTALQEQQKSLEEQRAQLEQERSAAQQAQAETERLQKELADLQAKQTDRGIMLTLTDVLFETNEAALKPGAARSLNQLAATLQSYPNQKVIIEGHTDSTGGADYNQKLSQHRAEAVASILRARGIASDRITTRGYGEIYPVATNETAVGRQQNRRVEIVLPRTAEELRGYFPEGSSMESENSNQSRPAQDSSMQSMPQSSDQADPSETPTGQ